MKKTNKTVSIILWIVTVVFLVGSFPVKHYFGQEYCDVMRIVGWVALIAFWIYYWVFNLKLIRSMLLLNAVKSYSKK